MPLTALLKAAALLLPFTTVSAMAPALRSSQALPARQLEARTFSGWITFRGEFALYDRRQDIGNTYDRSCYSGQMGTMRQQRDAARRYEGRHVRITGTLISAKDYWGADGFGKPVENFCARDQIIIGRSIVLDKSPTSPVRESTR